MIFLQLYAPPISSLTTSCSLAQALFSRRTRANTLFLAAGIALITGSVGSAGARTNQQSLNPLLCSMHIKPVKEIYPRRLATARAWQPLRSLVARGGLINEGRDLGRLWHGKPTGVVCSMQFDKDYVFGIVQKIRADSWRGKRICFSGYVESRFVKLRAGLFMMVYGKYGPVLSDWMTDRPVLGTRGSRKCSVVLDVPTDAVAIDFGASLFGTGGVWVHGLSVRAISRDELPTTNNHPPISYDPSSNTPLYTESELLSLPVRPMNLDFTK